MTAKRPATRNTLARNVRTLMDANGWNQTQLAQRSGVSQRQISNILSTDTGCSVEHADAIASAFGLQGWHLIMPTLHRDLLNGSLSKLVEHYAAASPEGRKAIDRLAELESRSILPPR